MNLSYSIERPSLHELLQFLYESNKEFDTPLEQKLDIPQYAQKLYENSSFIICRDDVHIVRMICCYTNRPPIGYISNVCVLSTHQEKGIFKQCFNLLIDYCKSAGIEEIHLEVNNQNHNAYNIYRHIGFQNDTYGVASTYMKKLIQQE